MAKKRNSVKKIKFGGGNLQLGGGVINHFRGWTSTGDSFSIRDVENSYNRIIKTLTKKYDIPYDYNIDGTVTPPNNLDVFEAETDLEMVDHPYTGYYKLSYNGSETRKIPYYLNSTDLNKIFEEDLGANFYVTNVGSLGQKSFGPYNFIAKTNGLKSAIQVSENHDENEMDAEVIVHSPGGPGFPSAQFLNFQSPSRPSFNYNVNLSSLDYEFEQEWQYRTTYRIYDLSIGDYTISGTTEWKDLNPPSEQYAFALNHAGTPENKLVKPFSIDFGNVYSGFVPLMEGDLQGGPNEEVYITGVVPSRTIMLNKSIEFGDLDINIDLQGNNSFNIDYFYLGGGSDMFTGSDYLHLNSIKINEEPNLKSFHIKAIDFPTTEYVKSIDLSGCSNLTHFCIEPFIKNLTGLSLQDCGITGFNSFGMARWLGYPSTTPYYYEPFLDNDNKIQYLDIRNNSLNATGVLNIILGLDNQHTGYLDVRNQNPPVIYDSILIEMIDELKDIGWEVDY